MAFIHKETFEIIQYNSIDDNSDDYFEADDLIALPIQVLNRKGYSTRFCCCGHPFDEIAEIFSVKDYSTGDCPFPNIIQFDEVKNAESPENKYRLLQWLGPDRSSYIVFEPGVTLPSLPEGFGIDDEKDDSIKVITYDDDGSITANPLDGTTTLKTYYDPDIPVYDYLAEILDAMRALYEWALDLPEIK